MSTTDVRQTAARILDGMTFNKEKLARDCVVVCDTVDRLTAALQREQQKTASLQRDLAQATKTAAPPTEGMPAGFADIFGDIFKGKQQ